MTEEITPEIPEEPTSETFPCPKCGVENDHYLRYIPSGMLKCPTCKKILKRDSIPEKFIEEVPSKKAGRKPKKPRKRERSERDEEDREGRTGLFRRVKTPAEVVEEVLRDHNAKDDFIDYVVKKAERRGGLYPEQLRDMLLNLDSGIRPKTEIEYIVGDFYETMQAETMKARDLRGSQYYPQIEEGGGYRETYYPPTESDRHDEMFYPRSPRFGQRSSQREDWRRPEVTRQDLQEFQRDILENIRKEKEADKFDKILETITEQSKDITALGTELMNIKENPPVVAPEGETDYEKSLKHTIERQDKRQEELMKLITDERKEHKADAKELREFYTHKSERLEDELKDAKNRPQREVGKYSKDEIQLAAEGMNRLADIAEKRKPGEVLIKVMTPEGETPPKREKVGKSRISSLVPEEMKE